MLMPISDMYPCKIDSYCRLMKKIQIFSLVLPLISIQLLVSCRSQMAVQENLPAVSQGSNTQNASTANSGQTGTSGSTSGSGQNPAPDTAQLGQENMSAEAAVAHKCVEAWRVAVKDKDEARAMAMLEQVDKDYPNVSTVQLMMGQVKDFFKKPKEALAHYRKAHAVNKFSSIQTLRLADSLRRNGEYKEASMHYDRLITNIEAAVGEYGQDDMAIVLASVRTGKAACLKAQGQKDEALAMVKKALKGDPQNPEAKELLKNLGG